MVDDFHGSLEWARLRGEHATRVPGPHHRRCPAPTIPCFTSPTISTNAPPDSRNPICLQRQSPYERDGFDPQLWRGIYDDQGRLMVMINFNMDLGDAWEHADLPEYALQIHDPRVSDTRSTIFCVR